MRRKIDLDSSVELSKLPALEMILVSIMSQYRESRLYNYYKKKSLDKEYNETVKKEENLKDCILSYAYGELVRNSRFKDKGVTCELITLAIPRDFEKVLPNVLKSKDFASYNVKVVPCDPDMLIAFNNLPIMIDLSKKMV